jgi:NDP-sugar pyrophosphorylase family protein
VAHDPGLAGVTAAVFAGGLGTRLRASVADRPKVLAEVCGRPFLAHLLDQLERAGVRDVVLCTGYLGEQVEAAFGARHGELSVRYSREDEPLGTGGCLRLAAPLLGSDPVLVLNGDSYCDADLGAFAAGHAARRAEGSILLTHVPDAGRYGRVELGAGGAVEAFLEKSSSEPGWINAGLYLLGRRMVESIPSEGVVSLERDILPDWVSRGLFGHETEGRFIDIGTPESYAEADRFFGSEQQL